MLLSPLKVRTPLPVVVMVPTVQVNAPVTVIFPVPVNVPFPVTAKLAIVMAAILFVRSLFRAAFALVSNVTPPEYVCVPVVLAP